MTTATASHYAAEYQTIASSLPGQALPWLQQLRREALEQFSAQGFPSPREEEWRYTNISGIEKKLFTPSLALTAGDIDAEWLNTTVGSGLVGRFSKWSFFSRTVRFN